MKSINNLYFYKPLIFFLQCFEERKRRKIRRKFLVETWSEVGDRREEKMLI